MTTFQISFLLPLTFGMIFVVCASAAIRDRITDVPANQVSWLRKEFRTLDTAAGKSDGQDLAPIGSPRMISAGRALFQYGHRLVLFVDEHTERLQRLVAKDPGEVHVLVGDEIGHAGREALIGLALRDQVELAFENVGDLDAGMGVRGCAGAVLDFNDAGVDGEANRKLGPLQHRALDASLDICCADRRGCRCGRFLVQLDVLHVHAVFSLPI